MKPTKRSLLFLLLLGTLMLSACNTALIDNPFSWPDENYSISEGKKMKFRSDGTFKILQFTDLHLTYGFDYNDLATLRFIKEATVLENPDLIVLTGDQTMSPFNERLYQQLIEFMDKLEVPWTFVFGNHDDESGTTRLELASMAMNRSNTIIFEYGPNNITGVGNFFIHLEEFDSSTILYSLVFMDSNAHRTYPVDGKDKFWYDYIYQDQIDWYEDMIHHVEAHAGTIVPSLAFFHIPLLEYNDVLDNPGLITTGVRYELPCTPYTNTGMFDKMLELGSTKGVFVGHDHINDFTYMKDGILLAYGRATGFNAYGKEGMSKGARVITINQATQTFITRVVTTDDLGGW